MDQEPLSNDGAVLDVARSNQVGGEEASGIEVGNRNIYEAAWRKYADRAEDESAQWEHSTLDKVITELKLEWEPTN